MPKVRYVLVALVVCLAPAVRAMDPRFSWETLETPHFQIHFHQGEYALAQRVARAAEEAHRRLAPLLDHEPRERCQIVVQDDTDFANGYATPLLFDEIHAFAAPPDSRSSLADFDDNVWELVSHEYTHILHLDTVGGVPDATNGIFGKLWIPNGGQPAWFIEGMATFAESEVSSAGRVRSSLDDLLVRTEALDGGLRPIDQLSNASRRWPRGYAQYTIGARFLSWVRAQYGLGALRDLSHDFGERAVPLGMNFSARRVLGKTWLELYDEFRADARAQAEAVRARVRVEGETRAEPLTALGEFVRSPRWSPDGRTLYVAWSGPDRLPDLRAFEPGPCCANGPPRETRSVAPLWVGGGDDTLAVAPDGALVYARSQIFQEYEEVQDLFSVRPDGSGERRLTRGVRAREPDVAPDGALVFVWRRPAGRTAIAELPADGRGAPRVLFEAPDGDVVGGPRVSPDGKRVAFLHHRDGAWDVRLIAREGGAVLDVTHDRALDRDPAWTPDGKYLLFSSDRTGIYDLYAWRAEDGALLRITHVVGGAFEPAPSPDGRQLAFATYSSRGYDVARMPLEPAAWTTVSAPPLADARPAPTPEPEAELFPAHPYDPLPTLRPHYWLPFVAADAAGSTLGVVTSGFDVAQRHDYVATAWWSLSGHEPGWDASYTNHTLYPDLSLGTSRDLSTVAGAGPYYIERETGASVSARFPFSQVERSQSLGLTYSLYGLSADQNPEHRAVATGRLATATLGWRYSDARRFVNSVSSELGSRVSAALRVSTPGIGSDFTYWQLSGSAAHYFALPWSRDDRPLHHVLALRASGGLSRGDLTRRHYYDLGGFQQSDAIRTLINPATAPSRTLRGFVADAFSGSVYALGTAEYRFPLFDPEVGPWTLPIYLRRLHAAVFGDVGDAWTPGRGDFALHAGAGLELRGDVVLGWFLPTDVRLGCAHGLEKPVTDAYGYQAGAIWDCYAALGAAF